MAESGNLGYPRIGARRELKRALEAYWKGNIEKSELLSRARELRLQNWETQKSAGITRIPSNDFSLYDHVLDMSLTVGAVPRRYEHLRDGDPLDLYFAMARGERGTPENPGSRAMEMTKWFDTNYHYIVPEIEDETRFELGSDTAVREYLEAKEAGIETRPVILGPVTFLSLAKSREKSAPPLTRLHSLLPVYTQLLAALADAGAHWVQIDEPVLSSDLQEPQRRALEEAYALFAETETSRPKIMLTSYFAPLQENLKLLFRLPVEGVHLDLIRGADDLAGALEAAAAGELHLSLGVVDGRNVWKSDLGRAGELVTSAVERLGTQRVEVAPSCSLLHTPVDLAYEEELDPELREWLAFARQKIDEVVAITHLANGRSDRAQELVNEHTVALARRAGNPRTRNDAVRAAVAEVTEDMTKRRSPFEERYRKQQDKLQLPLFPTTTIGSFPQTREIRRRRAEFRKGEISRQQYEEFLKEEIRQVVSFQEEAGLDLLVHGEPERNDMVEYFGEQLEGFTSTSNGWVQSYGSRCVKPPIIYGDLRRPEAMTLPWITYAQSLTAKPMKGMLTGPVTILQWSFVRDDQPRSETALQIALAIRQEVQDLEAAGIGVIQIDEPAFREGLPLRRAEWQKYLDWAVRVFRIATTGVEDETQIHTHMCYSEFNDIIASIAALDADVISIETSRSDMELLEAFSSFRYPNAIGPGVYDIHSPRVPPAEQMERLLQKALEVLAPEQLWVNPDCGLKTRGWEEVRPALTNLVEAARRVREKHRESATSGE